MHRKIAVAAAALLAACAHVAPTATSAPPLTPPLSPAGTGERETNSTRPPTPPLTPGAGDSPAGTLERETNSTRPPTPAAEITFALVGDVMLGSTFPEGSVLPPDEGRGLLAAAAPLLSAADVAVGNLEGPMLEGGTSTKCARAKPGHCYAFRMPTAYAATLRAAGFRAMSVANNHAGDFGAAGRASTRAALDAAGVAHSGEPGDVARLEVRGRKVALVAFATSEATNDLRDLPAARRVVEGLAAGADLVVVSFHGGAEGAAHQHVPEGPEEFYGEPRGDLRAFAHAMIDAGAALVFGHGPHVARGMEIYRGRLVAYSLGNFATWGSFNLQGPNALAPLLTVRLGPGGAFLGGRIHAFRQEKPGGPRPDPSGEVIRRLRDLSREDFGAAAVQVAGDGTVSAPPPPAAAQRPAGSSMAARGSP